MIQCKHCRPGLFDLVPLFLVPLSGSCFFPFYVLIRPDNKLKFVNRVVIVVVRFLDIPFVVNMKGQEFLNIEIFFIFLVVVFTCIEG